MARTQLAENTTSVDAKRYLYLAFDAIRSGIQLAVESLMTSADKTKPTQISLQMLLGLVTVIAVVLAIFTNPLTALVPLALIWLCSNIVYLSLSIYGVAIAKNQNVSWRSELKRQILLGVCPFALPVIGLLTGLLMEFVYLEWLEDVISWALMLSFGLLNPIILFFGNLEADGNVVKENRVIWWIRVGVILNVVLPLVLFAAALIGITVTHGRHRHQQPRAMERIDGAEPLQRINRD